MDILEAIVEQRRKDLQSLGETLGCAVPETRLRKAPVPFVNRKGVVLEVKRASPSKGDIAPGLDAAKTAATYAQSGACAISVLTESHWFKGSLTDLMSVCSVIDEYNQSHPQTPVAVLRKDFLLSAAEVDVAYRAGADAVLLISRILPEAKLCAMASRCVSLGMTAFIELRKSEDVAKLSAVLKTVGTQGSAHIVCGVNARDLSDFSIDLLTPCKMLPEIQALSEGGVPVVFESGVRTPSAASFVGKLGFTGLLLGESAARNPSDASLLVESFVSAKVDRSSGAWKDFASFQKKRETDFETQTCTHSAKNKKLPPLVKVCGLTSVDDALYATMGGADFLGFIFCAASPRNVSKSVVCQVKEIIGEQFTKTCQDEHIFAAGCDDVAPRLVGVVVDFDSEEGQTAVSLAQKGVLDFIQVHGTKAVSQLYERKDLLKLPHYCVVNVSCEKDLEAFDELRAKGEVRILIDAKAKTAVGGTGLTVDRELAQKVSKKTKLWLAGGIGPSNVKEIVQELSPELIDINSGVESAPGKKDSNLLLEFFDALA